MSRLRLAVHEVNSCFLRRQYIRQTLSELEQTFQAILKPLIGLPYDAGTGRVIDTMMQRFLSLGRRHFRATPQDVTLHVHITDEKVIVGFDLSPLLDAFRTAAHTAPQQ